MNEKQAIYQLKRGSSDALEWLIDRYTPYVSTVIYNIIGDNMTSSDIEEVASDAFLALWNNTGKIELPRFKAYLASIARNKAKNKLRECGFELSLEDDEIEIIYDGTPESAFVYKEQKQLVRQMVGAMRQPDKEIFLRHYYYCQTVEKIADEIGMNVSTVKSRLVRGRRKLKGIFEKLEKEGYYNENENLRPFGLRG